MDNTKHRAPADVAADASVKHTGKGIVNQVKGNMKETWGELTDNPKAKLEGKMDRVKGKAQEKLGELEGDEARLESGMGTRKDTDDEI